MAFQMSTGANTAAAISNAAYGSQRRSQRREGGSSSMNAKAAIPSSPIVYFEMRPMPTDNPAHSHARERPPISARSKKYSEAAHAAVKGASGVMSIPDKKKKGST